MINKYEIKKENNEDVLYLYLNYDYEFSKEFLSSTLSKIPFKGTLIKIVVGGVIISKIFLNAPQPKDNFNYNISNTIMDRFNPQYVIENSLNELDSDIEIPIENTTTVENIPKEENIHEITKEALKVENKINNIETDNKTEDAIGNKVQSEVKQTIVTVVRSSGVVEQIELEKYLIGVVGAEMPASFNIEAIKAQAVVARTYTLKKIKNGLSISDSYTDQEYKDEAGLRQLWGSDYDKYYNKIKNAVESTKGEYITYNGEYIEAVYHSTSNGYTESSTEVWGNYYEYLNSVESVWDKSATSYTRTIEITYDILNSKLGYSIDNNTQIEIISRNNTNRVRSLKIGNNYYTGIEFRNKLSLRSTDFTIEKIDNGISITTYGYGHGVGMSQYGAAGMAESGYNYKQIINHYYVGVNIIS